MRATPIAGNAVEQIGAAFQQSIAQDYQPTLALVFMSIKRDRQAECEINGKTELHLGTNSWVVLKEK